MKGLLVQLLSTFVISLPAFFSGYSITWPSYAIDMIQSGQTPISAEMSPYESNMIGSLPMIGSVIATIFTAYLTDGVGRKRTMILCGLCFVMSWAITTTAKTVTHILVARLISGIGMGMLLIVVYVYISEYVHDSIRGTMLSMLSFAYTFGTLASYISGWFMSFEAINYTNLFLATAFMIVINFLKETPSYLLAIGKEKEALDSLKFYRGESNVTQEILEEFARLVRQKKSLSKVQTGNDLEQTEECLKLNQDTPDKAAQTELSPFQILRTSKPIQRALIIISGHIILMVLMGTVAVQVYAGRLFKEAVPDLSPHGCAVTLAVSVVIGSSLAVICSDLVGRRTLMISTGIVCCTCLILLSSLLRWHWAPQWAMPAVVLIYSCFFQIGVCNVPFVQLAESFPTKIKSLVNTIATSMMWIANFVVLAVYDSSAQNIGLDCTFFIFAVFGILTTITAFIFMKETKKVPVVDILKMYEASWFFKRSSLKTVELSETYQC